MSRPETPPTAARPTLFGTARAQEREAPLRMLAPAARERPRWRHVLDARRHTIAAGALSTLLAVGALIVGSPVAHPPARLPTTAGAPAAVPATPSPVRGAPAVIESIAPAVVPVGRADAPTPAATPRTSNATARTATKPRPPAPPAPADADVDLLAAMVVRLQAAEGASDPCHAREPAVRDCPRAPEPAAVPRPPAR